MRIDGKVGRVFKSWIELIYTNKNGEVLALEIENTPVNAHWKSGDCVRITLENVECKNDKYNAVCS